MDQDAILSDAPAPVAPAAAPAPEPAAEERPLSPREQAMADIAARRAEQFAAEAGLPAEAPLDADAQLAAQVAPSVIADGFDQVRVRAKVDGEEFDVPLSQVMAQYQKHSTADRRLAEATRLLRDAEARAASNAAEPAPAPAAESAPAAPERAPETKEFLDALFSGDEDKAAQALDALVAGRQAPAAPIPDPQQFAAQVKQQLAVESALDSFARDYADVCSDPVLANLADNQLAHHLAQGTPFGQALDRAGQDVRAWVSAKTGGAAQAAPTAARSEKLERKAGLDTPRPAHLAAAHPGAAVPRTEEQIRADALAALIRARPGMAAG